MSYAQLQTQSQVDGNTQYIALSAAGTVEPHQRFVHVADGTYTVTLPAASAVPMGTIVVVFCPGSGSMSGTITMAEATAGCIALSATLTTTTRYRTFISTGSCWVVA